MTDTKWRLVGRTGCSQAASWAASGRLDCMTLVSSAVRNNLHVWQYVKDVLDRLLAGSMDYDSMLPWVWAEEHPDQIRQYQINENATRARSYEQKSRPSDRPSNAQ